MSYISGSIWATNFVAVTAPDLVLVAFLGHLRSPETQWPYKSYNEHALFFSFPEHRSDKLCK